MEKIKYLLLGTVFGFILVKAEVVSWFRIQEMFMFQSFHMYGVIMSAIVVGAVSVFIIKKLKVKTINTGEEIIIPPKVFTKGNIIGGFIFGLGWSLTGACPGPLYALTGSGVYVMSIALASAILGTFVYGWAANKLPH